MKKLLIMIALSMGVISAKTMHYKEIIARVKEQHPQFLAKEQMRLSLEAKSQADTATSALSLAANIANASPNVGDDAVEYSVGISKNIALGNTRQLSLNAKRLANEAKMLEREKRLIELGNTLQNLYHQSCMDRAYRELLEESLSSYEVLYVKKQKAYKFHEVSKKELLQLDMQMRTLRQKAQSVRAKERISKERLQDLGMIEESVTLSCEDMAPIVAEIGVGDKAFSLSHKAFEKSLLSLDTLYARYDRAFESIDLGASYDDELDTKRIGVGFVLPLSFSSQRNEQSRIVLLHQKELKKLARQNWLIEQKSELKRLRSELKNSYEAIGLTQGNVQEYEHTLMPLIEKSFRYGESSSLEYIFGRQKLLELSQSLIEMKKNYYNTLFTLYSTLEMEK